MTTDANVGAPRDGVRIDLLRAGDYFAEDYSDAVRITYARLKRLTPREREVVEHVLNAESFAKIASALNLSVKTVETHSARIHRKLQVTTNIQIFRVCFLAGVLAINDGRVVLQMLEEE